MRLEPSAVTMWFVGLLWYVQRRDVVLLLAWQALLAGLWLAGLLR